MADEVQGVEALLISGTVGSGKTTTAVAIGAQLRAWGIPRAVIDTDELTRVWPAPPDDPFNLRLELANLSDVARNCRAAGAIRLVVSGVVEDTATLRRYEEVLAVPVTLCRLRPELARVRARLIERHAPGTVRDWHLARSGELDKILDDRLAADCVIDPGEDDPSRVAQRVLAAIGWAAPAAGAMASNASRTG